MQTSLKQFGVLLIQSLVFWVLAFLLFALIRYNGQKEELAIFIDEPLSLPTYFWYHYALLIGLIIGVFYAIIEFLFETFLNKRLILGLNVIIKTIIYFIFIIASLSIISIFVEDQLDINLSNDMGWWRESKLFWNIVIYFLVASIVFSFIKIANDKFGRGTFFNMLIGKYRKPQEEERILMFLDLKDSTTIAESLGHTIYSQFIQDCFLDLNRILNKFDAEVYQYVGDEAVLSWNYKNGLKNSKCIELFFAFQNQLQKRNQFYNATYEFMPEFKAGLHAGKLMIAEVGLIKKELAYHGDVINTTARIQGECNVYNESLLISEVLLNMIKLNSFFITNHLGEILLKGKQSKINIYSIKKAYSI